MAEGYIVYGPFYFASEYIKQIDDTLNGVVWDEQWDDKEEEICTNQLKRENNEG
jgi:hypothetical protein